MNICLSFLAVSLPLLSASNPYWFVLPDENNLIPEGGLGSSWKALNDDPSKELTKEEIAAVNAGRINPDRLREYANRLEARRTVELNEDSSDQVVKVASSQPASACPLPVVPTPCCTQPVAPCQQTHKPAVEPVTTVVAQTTATVAVPVVVEDDVQTFDDEEVEDLIDEPSSITKTTKNASSSYSSSIGSVAVVAAMAAAFML